MPIPILSAERLTAARPRAFLAAVRDNVPALTEWPDDRVVAVGYVGVEGIASSGDRGADDFLDVAVEHGLDRGALDLVLGLAVTYLWHPDRAVAAMQRATLFRDADASASS